MIYENVVRTNYSFVWSIVGRRSGKEGSHRTGRSSNQGLSQPGLPVFQKHDEEKRRSLGTPDSVTMKGIGRLLLG